MKNYDLSQYVLQYGNTMLFPLTKEEILILKKDKNEFSSYIRLPFLARLQTKDELEKVYDAVDMEDEYWFLKSLWVGVDIKARAIVGYLKLEKIDEFNKIVLSINEENCVSTKRDDFLELFHNFLNLNNISYVEKVAK